MENLINTFDALSAVIEKVHDSAVKLGRLQAKKEMLDFSRSLHERGLISDSVAQLILMELSLEL